MIHRVYILILIALILPDIYLRFRCRRIHGKPPGRGRYVAGALIVADLCMCVYTLWLAFLPDFAPERMEWLTAYLFLLCAVFVPKFIIIACCAAADVTSRSARDISHVKRTKNLWISAGWIIAVAVASAVVYSGTIGFSRLTVRHIEYRSKDVPAAFDGYKIVQFSDTHVGSYVGKGTCILSAAVDSVMAQDADAIVFTGDLQNMRPEEIAPVRSILASVHARDGVYSVLGNHDYAVYIRQDSALCRRNEALLIDEERSLGWHLLIDDNRIIRRGADSIVVAGMENVSKKPYFVHKGDMAKTMRGVTSGAFVIMLEHDPTAWRKRILPECEAQLTLSGHTHAGQIIVCGLSPAMLSYKEWFGRYDSDDGRMLYVSAGVGGFVPFRFNDPGEIVVITLRRE